MCVIPGVIGTVVRIEGIVSGLRENAQSLFGLLESSAEFRGCDILEGGKEAFELRRNKYSSAL